MLTFCVTFCSVVVYCIGVCSVVCSGVAKAFASPRLTLSSLFPPPTPTTSPNFKKNVANAKRRGEGVPLLLPSFATPLVASHLSVLHYCTCYFVLPIIVPIYSALDCAVQHIHVVYESAVVTPRLNCIGVHTNIN